MIWAQTAAPDKREVGSSNLPRPSEEVDALPTLRVRGAVHWQEEEHANSIGPLVALRSQIEMTSSHAHPQNSAICETPLRVSGLPGPGDKGVAT